MRVAQVSCWRDPGRRSGAELLEAWTALPLQAAAADAAGVRVTVLQAAWRDEELERDGVRFVFVAEPPHLPARVTRAWPRRLLARALAARPQVVHLQGLGFPLPARRLAASGVPLLVQDHAGHPRGGWRGRATRWGLARAAGVAFTVREHARPFVEAGQLSPRVPVFEVLESTSTFTPGDVEAARRAAGVHGDPCLLWVARLDANKDPLTVLDALSAAAPALPGARLWMCYGESPLEERVRTRVAADPALAGRVHLLGRVPHARVQELCRAADFLLLASRYEASSYALLEATACGATPLVSDIPALRRMTRGGAVGGLFAPGDATALARLLAAQAALPRPPLRRAAREHFDRHLSLAALGGELRAAYEGVLRR
ncbi:MAG TPA: glycosyltransferase family 4 protein [Longimicrobiaceae bacterium]|nr:glycosyltransferase family 4 protein [Longimicrobiaceae bacterium]